MKKLWAVVILCLLLSMMTSAEERKTFVSGDFEYEYVVLEDGTAEITYYRGDEIELDVPEKLDGYDVTSIGDSAFNAKFHLRKIRLPNSINHATGKSFLFCKYLSIFVSPDNPYFDVIDGVLFSKPEKRLIFCPDTKEEYSVPEGVRIIGEDAFHSCNNLKSIILPESVERIENFAFGACFSLKSITLPKGLTSIGKYAFEECINLSSIALPEGLTSIGEHAFWLCTSLSDITLPDSLRDVGTNPFQHCTGVSFIVSSDHPYLAVIDNVLFSKTDKRLICCTDTKENYVVPDGTESIGDYAFGGCHSLSSIELPEGLISIGEGAFSICENLKHVTLPESLTRIEESAFFRCSSLQTITIPKNVTYIGNGAFNHCSDNLTITAPRDSYAAEYCAENGLNCIYSEVKESPQSEFLPDQTESLQQSDLYENGKNRHDLPAHDRSD